MQKIFRWGPVFLWAGLIFTVSSIPTLPTVELIWWDFVLKKSAHVIEYAIFYFLLVRAISGKLIAPWPSFGRSQRESSPVNITLKTWILAFIIALVYAASDEYHQSFVPGRGARVTDVGFDFLGMLISRQLIIQRFLK